MTLLQPLGLLALAAVPVLVALSLWRWRRREVTVSSLLLWRDVATAWRHAPHARRRRQLDPLLVLRVAVALALAGALCAPVLVRTAQATRRLIVVLDRSASMATRRPDGLTRWRAARDELLKLLVQLDAADRVEFAAVPPLAEQAIGAERDPRDAASRLLTLEPSDAAAEPADLRRAALDAQARQPDARVLVVTDTPLPDLPAGVGLLATGAPARNLGITTFAARPYPDGRAEVLIAVANANPAPTAAQVVLRADGRELGRRRVDVAGAATARAIFEVRPSAAAVLEARLEGADDLPADDRAWLARRSERLRVAWVGDECYYLRRALAVQDGAEVVELPEPPEVAVPGGFDLALYYRAVPRRLAAGSIVVVAPGAPVGALRPGPLADAAPASVVARRDPLMAAVRLDGLALGRVPRPALPGGFEALAAAGDVPVIGRWRDGAATVVYVGVDPAASAWPLDPSFPIFWANVVASAARQGQEAGGFGCSRPGQAIAVRAGAETVLTDPAGNRHALTADAFSPERVGLYRVRSGPRETPIAVSLLSEGETLGPAAEARPPAAFLAAASGTAAAATWRLGGWLALLGLGLVLVHGRLAARARPA